MIGWLYNKPKATFRFYSRSRLLPLCNTSISKTWQIRFCRG